MNTPLKILLWIVLVFSSQTSGYDTPSKIFLFMAENQFKPMKDLTLEMMNLTEGMKIIDVGIGEGSSEVFEIAEKVGKTGLYIGMEGERILVGQANIKAYNKNVSEQFRALFHWIQPGNPIPFEDGMFDIAYSTRVICATEQHMYVLNEMARVLKPGGLLLTTCPDTSSFSSNALSQSEEIMFKQSLEKIHPDKGSYDFMKFSVRDFKKLGMTDVSIQLFPLMETDLIGMIKEEIKRLLKIRINRQYAEEKYQDLQKKLDEGTFFYQMNFFITSGIKPNNWKNLLYPEENIELFNEEKFQIRWQEKKAKMIEKN